MNGIMDRLPPEVAQQVHPDWQRNESAYWARRESLRREYEGQWIGFADESVIAAGSSPVQVLHAAQRSGRPPFVTCVGREDTPQRMRRGSYNYDASYPGEPLPRVPVDFRSASDVPGLTFEDAIKRQRVVEPSRLWPWKKKQRRDAAATLSEFKALQPFTQIT